MSLEKDKLSIKADQNGIIVFVPDKMKPMDICQELYERFVHKSTVFQKSGCISISFTGYDISEAQAKNIVDFLNSIEQLKVVFVLKEKTGETRNSKVSCEAGSEYHKALSLPHKSERVTYKPVTTYREPVWQRPFIFSGDLKKGQTLEMTGNIILMGNVDEGARIKAGGNIVVLGGLHGQASASGLRTSGGFILALRMCPQKLKIGSFEVKYNQIEFGNAPIMVTKDNNGINISYL
jgi:septum site-determining protein MinC